MQVFDTAPQIEAFRLASIEGRLKLELKGIRMPFGRQSTFAVVKKMFGFKGSRERVLAQFQEHRRRFNEQHGFGTVTSDTAKVPRPVARDCVRCEETFDDDGTHDLCPKCRRNINRTDMQS